MKKLRIKTVLLCAFIAVTMFVPSSALNTAIVPGSCTIFAASFGDKALFGNNEDYTNPNTYYWVKPSGKDKYGGFYLGFDNFFPQGGINEKGLAFDFNALPEAPLNPHPELPGRSGLFRKIQETCATVEEAITLAKKYNWGNSIRWQVILADATGDAVVISAGPDKELAFTRKPKGDGYLVSTNFNRANPKNTYRGSYPCWRYDKAVEMLAKIEDEDDLTVDYFKSILDAAHVEGARTNTLYSNVFDLKKGIIYIYYWHQFEEVATLKVAEEIAKDTKPKRIKDLFSQETEKRAEEEIPDFPELKGPYLGQKPPGMTPEIFAPGIISTDLNEGSSGFNLDNTHFVFQRFIDQKVYTYEIERQDDKWSKPKLVPFAHMMRNGDFVFAPDGKKLYFQSNTPIAGLEAEERISNIWEIEKTATGWTEPQHLNFNINTIYADSFASITTDGTLYFFTRKPGGIGKSDMYKSDLLNGEFAEAINLGENFNTEEHEWDPFIAPDESYLIFCSTKPGGYGGDDFYISFKNEDLSWTKPVNMGEKFNSKSSENRPYVTPDGKYFFFTSTKSGNRDIYWADAKVINTYKPKESL